MRFSGLLLVATLAAGVASAQDCGPAEKKADCTTLSTDLQSARRDFLVARTDFKRLARVEQQALKAARKDVFESSPRGKAMAPAFGAAADLLEATAAAETDKKIAALCSEMAASYRAMARALDRKSTYLATALRAKKPAERASATYNQALALLSKPGEDSKEIAASWRMIKQGDPRYRALARNMKSVQASLAALDGVESAKGKVCLTAVQNLDKLLQVHFDGVATERPKPQPNPPPT